jgi:iron(III) transport system ATP-binding protein
VKAISIADLYKAFRDTAVLRSLDLEVERGSLTAILGPSGSGKTTLLRVIAGLERADLGRVSLAGEVVDDGRRFVRPESRRVGYVPQEASLFPHLTVDQNVGFGISRGGASGSRGFWRWSDWPGWVVGIPTSSPVASSSAWRWRGP